MTAKNLRFLPKETRDFSPSSAALREYKRIIVALHLEGYLVPTKCH